MSPPMSPPNYLFCAEWRRPSPGCMTSNKTLLRKPDLGNCSAQRGMRQQCLARHFRAPNAGLLEYGCVIHNPELCSFQSPKDLDMPQRKSSRLRRARRLLTIKSKLVKAPAIKINTVGRGNPLFTLPLAVTSSCPSLIFKRYLQF